jgi:hypothetical protein
MTRVALVFALWFAFAPFAPAADAPAADKDGWISLFDGKSLDGWKCGGEAKSFYVEDGKLVAQSVKGCAHLFYDGPAQQHNFKNFHFKAEVMTLPGANAGIYFHSGFQEAGWPKKGYEIQVNISHADPKKTGGLYGVRDCMDPPAKDNEWYTQEVIVKGKHIVSKVNGKVVVDYTEPDDWQSGDRRISSGTFALQAHDPKSKVFFRNLQVKPLAD